MLAYQYIAAALARSSSARPDLLVTASGELLEELNRIVGELFVDASIANAPFFSGEAEVAFDALRMPPAWVWPEEALRVYAVFGTAATVGVVVPGLLFSVVPHHDYHGATEMASVVEVGRSFIPVPVATATGQAVNPTGGTIKLRYARRANAFANLSSAIDADWPSGHDGLVVDLLATWLASKDGRSGDAETFGADAGMKFARFAAHVGLPSATTASRTGRNKGERLTTP